MPCSRPRASRDGAQEAGERPSRSPASASAERGYRAVAMNRPVLVAVFAVALFVGAHVSSVAADSSHAAPAARPASDVLALGVIIPVLPELVKQFMGGDTARAARITGVFGTVWALMQFIFSPLLGVISDRFGRRPVILVSCLGLGLDYRF